MNESLQILKSLVERYFQQTKEIEALRNQLNESRVAKDKLSVKLDNREATIEYLNNEVKRESLLKENRARMVDALSQHFQEVNEAVVGLDEMISFQRDKRLSFFKSKRELKEFTKKFTKIARMVEDKPLSNITHHEVPPRIDLVQNQYTPPVIPVSSELEKDYDCDFQDVGSAAKEMKLTIPQTEWESLQRYVQRTYGDNYMQYCFGGKIRLLRREDMVREISKSSHFFSKLKEKVSGKKCVVIGNGPSLNKHDFSLMEGNFMIGSNYIFMNRDHMGYYPDIITATNFLVVEQRLKEFLEVPVPKIFPFYMYNVVGSHDDVYYVNVNHLPEFSENITLWASTRSTVTYFNLQIAYTLGCEDTFLIGVDNTYKQDNTKREGNVIEQEEDDPNHFSPEYFKGLKWQAADPDNMASSYSVAKENFERAGRKIINAGIGGALEVFPRVDYKKALKNVDSSDYEVEPKTIDRVIVSINPDLQTYFGHYYQLDLKMSDYLSKRDDGFVILSHKHIDLDLGLRFPVVLPCFEEHSYTVGLRKVEEPNPEELFVEQLKQGIAKVKQIFPEAEKFEFYMYCGAFPHIRGVSKVIEEENLKSIGNCRFHIHIFYPSFERAFHKESSEQAAELYNGYNAIKNLKLYAGTEEYRNQIKSSHGVDVRYLPCFSTTFSDNELNKYRVDGCEKSKVVCFPGNMRPEKGLAVTIQALFLFAENQDFDDLKLVVRRFKRGEEEDEIDYYKCMLSERIRWIEGELSDEEFKVMMAGSDIIVIPYSKDAFEMRPSGLFADSILLEKPVLVEAGTFMARTVELFGNGMVYEAGNGRDMLAKIKEMEDNYRKLKLACKLARKTWEQDNSWSVFYQKLIN